MTDDPAASPLSDEPLPRVPEPVQKGLPQARREAVERWFKDNFSQRGDLGASVSVWCDGEEDLTLHHGWMQRDRTARVWTKDTIVPVWSVTKGPAALACLMALHEAGLSLEAPVAEAWPEFFLAGKEDITFAELLSHRAGLCAMTERVPIFDYDAVINALERQAPLWTDRRQGYHARTFGFLLDEIVRRLTEAETLGHYFDEVFGQPLKLDFWIGLPQEGHSRVATLYPGKMNLGHEDQAFLRAFGTVGSLTQQTFQSPMGLNGVQDMNQPHTWQQCYPAFGGIGSAQALAKFYAVLANGGKWRGEQIVPTWILRALSTPLSTALDGVLCVPMTFSAGMMMDPLDPETGRKQRQLFGPGEAAFGHAGAGGSLAFADPDTGIAFAYVMNQMETGVLPGEKAQGLVRAVFGSS